MAGSDDAVEAVMMDEDGSVVLVGYTNGDWIGDTSTLLDNADFAAAKLDPDGNELWRWQVSAASRRR